jgi:hypothetical protein
LSVFTRSSQQRGAGIPQFVRGAGTLYAVDAMGGGRNSASIRKLSANKFLGIFSNSTPRRLWVDGVEKGLVLLGES